MTKIEELIESIQKFEQLIWDEEFVCWPDDVERIMKQYAEFYAQRCLEIAAKEASANFECIGAVLGAENVNPYVEQESILKIKLPPHD